MIQGLVVLFVGADLIMLYCEPAQEACAHRAAGKGVDRGRGAAPRTPATPIASASEIVLGLVGVLVALPPFRSAAWSAGSSRHLGVAAGIT